jgi:chromosome segregation ATPase
MGLFRREKKDEPPTEQVRIKSPEEIQKERFEGELAYLQEEVRTKTEHLNSILEKLGMAKEEYERVISDLMASKKLINEKKTELVTLEQEHSQLVQKLEELKSKLDSLAVQQNEKDSLLVELEKVKDDIKASKLEHARYKAESQDLEAKLKTMQATYEKMRTELAKEASGEPVSVQRHDTSNIVAAASSVVASLNNKLAAMQKELEVVRLALQKERAEHRQTKDKLSELTKDT